jgi:uncharacterized protein
MPSSASPAAGSPVDAEERLASLDVLRGVALLGILAVNIWSFALPNAVFYDPSICGGFSGVNRAAWLLSYLLCEQKMMTLFSLLFGAGFVILSRRSQGRSAPLSGIYFRRLGWLLVFGLLHAYLLWDGDILTAYALCGLALYPLRRARPAWLIGLGLGVFLVAVPLVAGLGLAAEHLQQPSGQSTPARAALEDLLYYDTDPESVKHEIAVHCGDYAALFRHRAESNLWQQTIGFVLWTGPRAGGLMLVGMGLMQLGVFAASWSFRFYARLAVVGYGIGLPLVGFGVHDLLAHDFDMMRTCLVSAHFNYVGSLFVALGHLGVVMLVCKAGRWGWLTARLAAVGRMALTNYLLQTLLCTALFDGWGLGLFGSLERAELLGVVGSVWLVQLAVSPVWLRLFRFGPMEWLWRCLTYRRLVPFRVAAPTAPAGAALPT